MVWRQDIVVSKTQERGVTVPGKLMRELQRGSEQPDGGKRLYKLDIRRAHLTDAHVRKKQLYTQQEALVQSTEHAAYKDGGFLPEACFGRACSVRGAARVVVASIPHFTFWLISSLVILLTTQLVLHGKKFGAVTTRY